MRASDGVSGLQECGDLTDGGAARLGARRLNRDKMWWSYNQPTSGMGTTWFGV